MGDLITHLPQWQQLCKDQPSCRACISARATVRKQAKPYITLHLNAFNRYVSKQKIETKILAFARKKITADAKRASEICEQIKQSNVTDGWTFGVPN